MAGFVWALSGFVFLHIGAAAAGARDRAVAAIGLGPYRALFSVASLGLLAWLVQSTAAVRADPFDPLNAALWSPPEWVHWPAVAMSLLGVALALTGLLTPGPTLAGFERRALAQDEPARGVLRITRHPFLWGVAVWALGHLLANGERFAVMLFGALALLAIYGARSIDRKGRAAGGEAWARFEDATSNVPFVAITQERNRLSLRELGWRAIAGLAAALAIVLLHQRLFGAPALSTPS